MATAKSPLWMMDTNILVYAHNANDPRHAKAKALRDDALRGVVAACVTPQVLYEVYANVGHRYS